MVERPSLSVRVCLVDYTHATHSQTLTSFPHHHTAHTVTHAQSTRAHTLTMHPSPDDPVPLDHLTPLRVVYRMPPV